MSTLINPENVVKAIKYAVKTRKDWEAFVRENGIDRDGIKDAARAVAALAYPNDEPVQSIDGQRTRFGNAVQAAGYMMRQVLASDSEDSTAATVNLITKAGAKATRDEVLAAWEAAQASE